MLSSHVVIVHLDDPAPWPEVRPATMIWISDDQAIGFAVLESGMESGLPSVAIRADLPDGHTAIIQTSLNMLIAWLAAARGAFPDAFDGGPFDERFARPGGPVGDASD